MCNQMVLMKQISELYCEMVAFHETFCMLVCMWMCSSGELNRASLAQVARRAKGPRQGCFTSIGLKKVRQIFVAVFVEEAVA